MSVFLPRKLLQFTQKTVILSEYYGIEKMPSTIESAIVQIVDGMIKKLEALEKTSKIAGGRNKEMVKIGRAHV